jgi:hypothetical protein
MKPHIELAAIASTLYAGGIDRLIDRAAAITAKYPPKRARKSPRRPLARTA